MMNVPLAGIPIRLTLLAATLLGFFSTAYCGKVYLAADMKIDVQFKGPLSTTLDASPPIVDILEVASHDTIAGVEVIRKGGRVFGEIVEFKKPGHLGKPGSLKIRIDSLQTVWGKNIGVKPVTLSAVGKSKKLKAFLMLPLLGYGYFVKGGDAVLAEKDQKVTIRTAKFEEISF